VGVDVKRRTLSVEPLTVEFVLSVEPLLLVGDAAGAVRAAPVGGRQRARGARGANAVGRRGKGPATNHPHPSLRRFERRKGFFFFPF
jgi:hypothetical protein